MLHSLNQSSTFQPRTATEAWVLKQVQDDGSALNQWNHIPFHCPPSPLGEDVAGDFAAHGHGAKPDHRHGNLAFIGSSTVIRLGLSHLVSLA